MKKIIIFITIFLELFFLINSKPVIIEFRNTLNICLYSLMPSMFFSILFSNILLLNGFEDIIPFNNKRNISIFILSMLSGYPNNIKLLKEDNNEYMNYVTNFVNPLFLIGTVGSIYLKDLKLVLIILISHYISNIIMFILLKNKININTSNSSISKDFYSKSVKITINTLVIIFSNLLLISLLISLLKLTLSFSKSINSFIFGILEFSKGIYEISLCNIDTFIKGLLILIIITFGSISIHLQAITINPKIKYIKFLLFRILNVLISIIIYLLIYKFY